MVLQAGDSVPLSSEGHKAVTWHTLWGDREEWEWEGQNDKHNMVNTVKEGVNNRFVSTLGISLLQSIMIQVIYGGNCSILMWDYNLFFLLS